MKVYVITRQWGYDGGEFLAVCTKPEKAIEFVTEQYKKHREDNSPQEPIWITSIDGTRNDLSKIYTDLTITLVIITTNVKTFEGKGHFAGAFVRTDKDTIIAITCVETLD